MGKNELENAIERLADLYEYGHLEVSLNPAEFIKRVTTEIIKCRTKYKRGETDGTTRT